MSPCVAVQVSSTPLGVWPVPSNTSTDHFSMVTCGNVRTDSDPLVLECFSFFGSSYLGILKIWELWTWIFNGDRLDYLLCLYKSTKPPNRPLPFSFSRVLENIMNMCTGSRLNGKRGCCCWQDARGEQCLPWACAARQCDMILRLPRAWQTSESDAAAAQLFRGEASLI